MSCNQYEVSCGYADTESQIDKGQEAEGETGAPSDQNRPPDRKGFWFGYASALVQFPIQICVIILMLTIICGAVGYIVNGGAPTFESPRKGFETRGTEVGKYLTSLFNLRAGHEDVFIIPGKAVHEEEEERSSERDKRAVLDQRCPKRHKRAVLDQTCPIPGADQVKVVFKAKDKSDVFSAGNLISLCRHEEALVRQHPKFLEGCVRSSPSCCPNWSLGYVVALMNNKTSCLDITDADVEYTLQVLDRCRTFYQSGLLEHPKDEVDIPVECTEDNLVYITLHYLTVISSKNDSSNALISFSPMYLCGGFSDCEDILTEIYQDTFEGDASLEDDLTKVVAVDFDLKFALFDQFLVSDFLYVLLGALGAFCIIWLYTHSLFITISSIMNMIMSVVMAFFIYFVILRLKFFPFVNVISAVLVIGIGADDTFVYMDLWREAQKKIGSNNHDRVHVLEESCRHAFSTMFVTSFTTSSALFATMLSDIIAIKCFGAFAGSAILINFVYTITWLPAVIIIHDKYFSINPSRFQACADSESCGGFFGKSYKCITTAYHSPNRFFESFLPKLIWNLRFLFIIVFLAIGICGFVLSFVTPGLALPDKNEFQLFRDDHLFEQYDLVYRSRFAFDQSEKPLMPIYFVWGVIPEDNGNYWDPDETGDLELDPSFDISSPESQEWLHGFCNRILDQEFIDNSSNSHFCFMDDFKVWMSRPCFTNADSRCCEQPDFPFPEEVFDVCVQTFWKSQCTGFCEDFTPAPGIRFDVNGKVNVLFLAFESTRSFSLQYSPVNDFWNELSKWTKAEVATAPSGLSGGWSVSQIDIQLYFYDLQAGIASGIAASITLSLAVASVVLLLSTRNILTTILAVLTISCIVFTLVGVLVLLGWELNVFESAILSLAVGLSVDFTIHYGVAFRLAPFHKRKDRAIYAIRTLSSAITVAALSTFTAGAFMLPATVINYVQLGIFLTLVMSISWLYSNFFFLPLCMFLGPNHNCGQLPTVHCHKKEGEQQEKSPVTEVNPKSGTHAVNESADPAKTTTNDVDMEMMTDNLKPSEEQEQSSTSIDIPNSVPCENASSDHDHTKPQEIVESPKSEPESSDKSVNNLATSSHDAGEKMTGDKSISNHASSNHEVEEKGSGEETEPSRDTREEQSTPPIDDIGRSSYENKAFEGDLDEAKSAESEQAEKETLTIDIPNSIPPDNDAL